MHEFAKLMGGEEVEVDGAGHFCDGKYDKSFDELLPYLDTVVLGHDL